MSRAAILLALMLVGGTGPTWAHESSVGVLNPWSRWSFEPLVLIPLGLVGACWLTGLVRLSQRARTGDSARYWRNAAFASGWMSLALALCSPLHSAGRASFLAHMSEHEILMLIAAPLLALSRPSGVLVWGLPRATRHGISRLSHGRGVRSTWRFLTDPVVATVLHGSLVWFWHMPAPFDAAVRDETMHTLQHVCFFGSAVLFWWAMFNGHAHRRGYGLAALALLATATHSGLLGALLVVSPRVWYSAYDGHAAALSALEDQQLAGLVMWVPAGQAPPEPRICVRNPVRTLDIEVSDVAPRKSEFSVEFEGNTIQLPTRGGIEPRSCSSIKCSS